jgi:hypothetical protein
VGEGEEDGGVEEEKEGLREEWGRNWPSIQRSEKKRKKN